MSSQINFFDRFSNTSKRFSSSEDIEVRSFLIDLEKYLIGLSYASVRNPEEVSRFLFAKTDETAVAWNVSEEAVRVKKRRLSRKVFSVLGNDFFMLFDKGEEGLAEAKSRLSSAQDDSSTITLFPSSLISQLRSVRPAEDVSMSDCADELAFLNRYCNDSMERELSDLDATKLAYLFDVVDNKTEDKSGRRVVLKAIRSPEFLEAYEDRKNKDD